MPKTRFVIMSTARSGTSLLSETLNSHPDIVCHGEIFHPDPKWHLKGNLSGLPPEQIRALRADAGAFLEKVFDQPGAVAVGFKMWRDQEPDACLRLLRDETISKIIYERRKKLAQYSSGALAERTGVWNISRGDAYHAPEAEKLPFNPADFRRFLDYQRAADDFYRANVRGPFVEVVYSEIVTQGLKMIQGFLGVEILELQPQKKKLYSSDIIGRFDPSYHPLIRRTLGELGFSEWISE